MIFILDIAEYGVLCFSVSTKCTNDLQYIFLYFAIFSLLGSIIFGKCIGFPTKVIGGLSNLGIGMLFFP